MVAINKYNTLKLNKVNKEFAVFNNIKAFQNKKVFLLGKELFTYCIKVYYTTKKSLLYYINNIATREWHK